MSGYIPQHRPDDERFEDIFADQLKRAPWMLISAALHGVIFLLLSFFAAPDSLVDEAIAMETSLDQNVDPEVEPPPEKPNEDEEPVDAPTDDLVPQPDREDVVDMPPSELLSESESESDEPNGPESLIGVGAGPVGPSGGDRYSPGSARGGGDGWRRNHRDVVKRGLEWLMRHQSPDGRWDADDFCHSGNGICEGGECLVNSKGGALHDVGVTGLAMLAYLGAGQTHSGGEYAGVVRRGIRWLIAQQDSEGCIGQRTATNFTYDHAIATFALAEAYLLSRSLVLKPYLEKAVEFVTACQNPYGAWRYGVSNGDNDVSVTGWMIMALKASRDAGIDVDEKSLEWALEYVDKMTDEETGRTGYMKRGEPSVRAKGRRDQFPAVETESLTAVGMCSRVFAGKDPASDPMIRLGTRLLEKRLPQWNQAKGSIDMYYWYYATLAMFQVGGQPWRAWNKAMKTAIVDTQRSDGGLAGSWDPIGAWGQDGGRVYSTALMTLCLEVYYRYGRVLGAR